MQSINLLRGIFTSAKNLLGIWTPNNFAYPSFHNKSKLIVFLGVCLIGTILPLSFANAGPLDMLFSIKDLFEEVQKALGVLMILITPFGMIKFLLSLLQIAAMIPIAIGAGILNFILSDFFISHPYTSGGIVDAGWPITRDLANMALVVILIVIAVSTMLGSERRGLRSLLPKLIGIALIINFTQVIAGVIIDFSNIITYYFLSPVLNIGNLFMEVFWQGSPFHQMWSDNVALFQNFSLERMAEWIKGSLSIPRLLGDMIQTLALWIISLMIMIALLAFAFVFLIRYIVIWLLVIVSPLAFVAMILPDTAKFANQWWQKFIHWSFIGVFPAFMLFLVAKMLELKSGFTSNLVPVSAVRGGFVDSVFSGSYSVISELLFWLVVVIFMFIGLSASLKMNSKMSNIIVKRGKTVINNAGKWATKEAWQRGGRSEKLQGAMEKAEKGMARIPTWMGGGIAERGARNFQRYTQQKATQKFTDAEKEAKGFDTGQEAVGALERAISRKDDVRITEYLKRGLELYGGRYDRLKRAYISKNPGITEVQFNDIYANHAKSSAIYGAGVEGSLLKARPDLYNYTYAGRSVTPQMKQDFFRGFSADDWNKVAVEGFDDPEVRDAYYTSDDLTGRGFARSIKHSVTGEMGSVISNSAFTYNFMRDIGEQIPRVYETTAAPGTISESQRMYQKLDSDLIDHIDKQMPGGGPSGATPQLRQAERIAWINRTGPPSQSNASRFFRATPINMQPPGGNGWLYR